MKLILAFVIISFASSIVLPSDSQDAFIFSQFMRTFSKVYNTPQEYNHRFQVFRNNLREIERRNRESTSATYNVTKFADMTREEFRTFPCGVDKLSELANRRPGFETIMATPEPFVGAVPDSFDWVAKGAVTPVKDQQQCGSCWAFSTIGNVEGVWFLAGHPLTRLSEQEIVSCSTTDYGCQGGWPFWALTDMLKSPYNGRIDTEASYPYTSGSGEDGTCKFKSNDVGATIKSYKSYCTESTSPCKETDMQQLLITYGPLSVCLDAGPMQYYQGGVDDPSDCNPDAIDHCVTLVGYGVDKNIPFWRLKNSWNTNWGEQGFYRLVRGKGACGINKVITVASVK